MRISEAVVGLEVLADLRFFLPLRPPFHRTRQQLLKARLCKILLRSQRRVEYATGFAVRRFVFAGPGDWLRSREAAVRLFDDAREQHSGGSIERKAVVEAAVGVPGRFEAG